MNTETGRGNAAAGGFREALAGGIIPALRKSNLARPIRVPSVAKESFGLNLLIAKADNAQLSMMIGTIITLLLRLADPVAHRAAAVPPDAPASRSA